MSKTFSTIEEAIAAQLSDGQIVGVGTGSTVKRTLATLAQRIKSEQLSVAFVPTSLQTSWLCEEQQLSVLAPQAVAKIDWGFDGADEIDGRARLIKGGGGAMFQEKIMAKKCQRYIIIADEAKRVTRLGEKFPVPLEVFPSARKTVIEELEALKGKEICVRGMDGSPREKPFLTEQGNIILDVRFSEIDDNLEDALNSITGVVENGLFLNFSPEIFFQTKDGVEQA